MAKDQRTETLPESEAFWNQVDNDPTREFYAACVFNKIRNASPSDEKSRIEFIAQLKCMVELMDSPKTIFNSIVLNKIQLEESKELEEVI